jgi:hypothetical protein
MDVGGREGNQHDKRDKGSRPPPPRPFEYIEVFYNRETVYFEWMKLVRASD